jgi:hypothetical protein
VIDEFFKGNSITEKGTLCHLRNVFGHRNVTKDVGETFNHVSDFILFVTLGYTILLTMNILDMQHLDDEPMDWVEVDGMSTDEKLKYLENLSAKIIDLLWRDLGVSKVLMDKDEKAYEYCIWKEGMFISFNIDCNLIEKKPKNFLGRSVTMKFFTFFIEADKPMVECSGVNCERGKLHVKFLIKKLLSCSVKMRI